jgi:hypothetical protein
LTLGGIRLAATLLLAVGLGITIAPSASAQPDPKPVVVLFEYPGADSMTSRLGWPAGPRFVLYDDGLVLEWPQGTDSNPALPPAMSGKLDREAAEKLRASIASELADVDPSQRGSNILDIGTTKMLVWDDPSQAYKTYDVNGWPCLAKGQTGSDLDGRENTSPRFLDVCDRLLQFPIDHPQQWTPSALWLVLTPPDKHPTKIEKWPADWPAPPRSDRLGAQYPLCVTLGANQSDFTRRLSELRWDDLERLALSGSDGQLLAINDWTFGLPGTLPDSQGLTIFLDGFGGACPR